MEQYSINDVEILTGIKAHTLRIWEKRYKTLLPHRTATRIRYYDDDQVRRLLNISTLLQMGHKPSQLLSMPEEDIHKLLTDQGPEHTTSQLHHIYISDLIKSMIAFDERLFDKICTAVITRWGVYEAMITVIYPFLEKTGILWNTTNVIPAQEHFASNIIRRKLCAAIDGIPIPGTKNKKYLLFLPPGELHEIGLMLADYMIRSAGHETIYLGQDLPPANLKATVEKIRPDYLVTFSLSGNDPANRLKYLQELSTTEGKLQVIVCGRKPVKKNAAYTHLLFVHEPGALTKYI